MLGDFMFLVLNKEKIYAYLVSAVTVIMLFFVANIMTENKSTVQTSSSNVKQLPIYNVETEENKISITMNCAW